MDQFVNTKKLKKIICSEFFFVCENGVIHWSKGSMVIGPQVDDHLQLYSVDS